MNDRSAPLTILVDADACPVVVRQMLFRAAERTGVTVTLVANQSLPVPPLPQVSCLQVSSGFDVADNEIVKRCEPDDLVITSDIPLAAEVIAKGGMALNPRGERYTEDTIRFSGCSQDADGNTVPIWNTAVAALTGSNTNVQPNECLTYSADFSDNVLARKKLAQNNVSWRAGVNFEPDPDALLYATVSRGYKSGAFPVLPANVETQFEPAVQERLTAYEIGAKLSPVDFLRFNASGFFYQYKDKQLFGDVEDPVFTTLSRIVNVPKSEVYGAELEAFVQATNELRLQTSATYVHSEITEFVGINRLGNLEDFAGNEFPNTPNWQVNGQLAYDGRISPAVGLKAVLSASYQGAAEGAVGAGREFRIDPYTLVNGTVSTTLMDDRLELGLFGRNVLNEKYYTTVDTVIDTIFSVPGMPRTYGLYIEYRFD